MLTGRITVFFFFFQSSHTFVSRNLPARCGLAWAASGGHRISANRKTPALPTGHITLGQQDTGNRKREHAASFCSSQPLHQLHQPSPVTPSLTASFSLGPHGTAISELTHNEAGRVTPEDQEQKKIQSVFLPELALTFLPCFNPQFIVSER